MTKVVRYNGKIYLWYKTNMSGFAQLLTDSCNKFPGTPHRDKLEVLKDIPCVRYNGHKYAITKQGIFSCTTGNRIHDKNILELAKARHDFKVYYCKLCGKNPVDAWAGSDTCDECLKKQ